jgi:GAF domain-containing protein
VTNRTPRPTLDALTRAAVTATGASRGRLLTVVPGAEHLTVAAAHGGDAAWSAPGVLSVGTGIAGYVVATGQPQVLTSRQTEPPGLTSELCIPCIWDDEVVGAIEVADKVGSGAFTFDDLELACLLGRIAAVAIAGNQTLAPPDPDRLVGDLGRLALADPVRYATIALLVRRLLDA